MHQPRKSPLRSFSLRCRQGRDLGAHSFVAPAQPRQLFPAAVAVGMLHRSSLMHCQRPQGPNRLRTKAAKVPRASSLARSSPPLGAHGSLVLRCCVRHQIPWVELLRDLAVAPRALSPGTKAQPAQEVGLRRRPRAEQTQASPCRNILLQRCAFSGLPLYLRVVPAPCRAGCIVASCGSQWRRHETNSIVGRCSCWLLGYKLVSE